MSIFDLIVSRELALYWDDLAQDREPYPMEEKFPNQKKLGLNLKWMKGSKGLPVTLNTSAFDAAVIPRPRIGVEQLMAQMPFFKESKYIDEELRQELNMVMESGNQTMIDIIVNRIFDDEMELLESARSTREMMRCMLVTSGMVSLTSNGQVFDFDYGIPAENKVDASVAWSDYDLSDPIEDMRVLRDAITDATGVTPTQAMCSGKTLRDIRRNKKIIAAIYAKSPTVGAVNTSMIREYIMEEVEIDVVVNDKRYRFKSADGSTVTQTRYIPEDVFTMFPDGALGNTWFGTTPEESDLMASAAANVSIVDTGVAITTMEKADPVNVETKVSMICLPDLPTADHIGIIDTNP